MNPSSSYTIADLTHSISAGTVRVEMAMRTTRAMEFTIYHSISGDVITTLTMPAGTAVTLHTIDTTASEDDFILDITVDGCEALHSLAQWSDVRPI